MAILHLPQLDQFHQKKRGKSHFGDSSSATPARVWLLLPVCAYQQAMQCIKAQHNEPTERMIPPAAQTGPCVPLSEPKTGERQRRKAWRRTERRGEGSGGGEERNVTTKKEKKLQDEWGHDEQHRKVWLYLLIKPSFAFVLLSMIFRMSELPQNTLPFPAGLSDSRSSSSSAGSKAQLCSSVRTGEQRSA